MALPLNMSNGDIRYEVPFGVLHVGKDELKEAVGERYKTLPKDVHPRGIENWIGAENGDFGVTLSSSVAVLDYIDPADKGNTLFANNQLILQPILLSSRRSCHWEGNEYLQTGDHSFTFSLTSYKAGKNNDMHFGKSANENLMIIANPKPYADASLPEELSFFYVNNSNLIISAVKKAEDDNSVVIRLFNESDNEIKADLKSFRTFNKAYKTNLIEEPEKTLSPGKYGLNINVGKFAIETFLLN
jgi:alpha-mannosidase